MLCSVGFASPPDWLKPYSYLSQGEKMRVDIARALCLDQPITVFDEFTSVVDREVAKIGSYAISKAVRRVPGKKFIAVTCHFDVIDWLEPDWVFSTDTMEFIKKKERHPAIDVSIHKCSTSMWQVFRQYHYLNGKISSGARCYVALYKEKPIAFIAVMHIHMRSNYYRVSRLVVLPDYQGIGVGKKLLNFIAELYTSQVNLPFYLVTSNPQLVRGNLGNWRVKRVGHGTSGGEDTRINRELTQSNSKRRLSVSLQYIPKKKWG
jgi:GNAT superfamily N-acetyltransferase